MKIPKLIVDVDINSFKETKYYTSQGGKIWTMIVNCTPMYEGKSPL